MKPQEMLARLAAKLLLTPSGRLTTSQCGLVLGVTESEVLKPLVAMAARGELVRSQKPAHSKGQDTWALPRISAGRTASAGAPAAGALPPRRGQREQ